MHAITGLFILVFAIMALPDLPEAADAKHYLRQQDRSYAFRARCASHAESRSAGDAVQCAATGLAIERRGATTENPDQ
jgi:hypothetical protein